MRDAPLFGTHRATGYIARLFFFFALLAEVRAGLYCGKSIFRLKIDRPKPDFHPSRHVPLRESAAAVIKCVRARTSPRELPSYSSAFELPFRSADSLNDVRRKLQRVDRELSVE